MSTQEALSHEELDALASKWESGERVDLSPANIGRLIASLEKRVAAWHALPHQIPPEGDWYGWLLFGGRGAGKTDGSAHYVDAHVKGPPCDRRLPGGHRIAIVAPTLGDAAESCVNGPSGLRAIDPDVTMRSEIGGTIVRWPNGAEAKLFGAHTGVDTDRLRAGGNRCLVWAEEAAAWRRLTEGIAQAQFGLRIGPHPRIIGSTTPKNRPMIREILRMAQEAAKADSEGRSIDVAERWIVTAAPTSANPHLPLHIRQLLYRRYAKTRLGRQELLGLLLEDLGSRISPANFSMVDRPPAGPGWVRVRYWDLASTDAGAAADPDWTAGVRMAWNATKNLMVVEHMVHGRWSAATVQEKVLATARADGPDVVQWIEQDPGQAGVAQVTTFKKALSGIARCEGNRPTGAKEVRAQAFETLVEQQRTAIVDGSWVRAFFDECESWGSGADDDALDKVSSGAEDGIHDDQIDACSGAVYVLTVAPTRTVRRLGVPE